MVMSVIIIDASDAKGTNTNTVKSMSVYTLIPTGINAVRAPIVPVMSGTSTVSAK